MKAKDIMTYASTMHTDVHNILIVNLLDEPATLISPLHLIQTRAFTHVRPERLLFYI